MPSILSDGIQIHYEERGSGPPLILLMGLGAPGSLWADHAAAYEQHFRCYLIDNRGAGESDQPPGPYTTRMMAEDTAQVMLSLGIEQARVAGLSMGSAIAQELALAHPNLVRSLVLISSWARCDPYTQAVFDHFKKMRALAAPADFVQLLQLWIASPPYYAENLAKLVQDHSMIAHLIRGLEQAIGTSADGAALLRHLDGIGAIMESHFRFEEKQLVGLLDAIEDESLDKTELFGPIA